MKTVAINELSEEEQKELLHFSPTKQFPLLKTGEVLITGALPILRYILSSDEQATSLLFSTEAKEVGCLEMWLNFLLMTVAPICAEIMSQLLGRKPLNQEILNRAIEDLMEELLKVNGHLKFKTFFQGHSIKWPDLLCTCLIFDVYKMALLKENREKIPNVIRHFLFIMNLAQVKQFYSEKIEECNAITPLPFVPKEETKKEEEVKEEGKKSKKDKKQGKKLPQEKDKEQEKAKEKKEKKEKKPKEEVKKEEAKP